MFEREDVESFRTAPSTDHPARALPLPRRICSMCQAWEWWGSQAAPPTPKNRSIARLVPTVHGAQIAAAPRRMHTDMVMPREPFGDCQHEGQAILSFSVMAIPVCSRVLLPMGTWPTYKTMIRSAPVL